MYIDTAASFHQVLVCAPSNVAVDQLAEKISATGLKVNMMEIISKALWYHWPGTSANVLVVLLSPW